MVAASVGKKQIGKTMLTVLIVAIAAVAVVVVIGKVKEKKEAAGAAGETGEQREEYLRSVGLQVDTTSSVAEVKVPQEFDDRFTQYNAILAPTGFDLSGLRGETVMKCTYRVTNRSDLGENISAVLLVHGGRIVGGHLLDTDTGALYPLFGEIEQPAQQEAQETILPSAETTQGTAAQTAEPSAETAALPESAYPSD